MSLIAVLHIIANHDQACHHYLKLGYWIIKMFSNSNWTKWSTIQGVNARVISKLDEREARGRFEITSTITP